MSDPRPIGVFDSGVGGLTVAGAIMAHAPDEPIVYLGDGARFPYGPRPVEEIRSFGMELAGYLVNEGVKLLVVACNSVEVSAIGDIAAAHDASIQVIAAEPELGDLVYGLRSLDDGFVPPIFDPAQIDRKFLVNASDSLRATRELTAREGVFAGISSGAVLQVAQRVAAELAHGDIVCLLPDGGWKYLSTQAWAEDVATAEKGVEESLWW